MSVIPKDIIHIVYDIYHSTTDYEERRELYMTKYPEFVIKYSNIFEMLCKPRFNFDKFIEITFALNKPNMKRTRCSEEALYSDKKRKRYEESDEIEEDYKIKESNIATDILVDKLKNLFHEQNIAIEYFV